MTHPKDFPADAWSAHFSDIIGASHAPTFRFWKKDGLASDGLKQFAEVGDSKDLESELKAEVCACFYFKNIIGTILEDELLKTFEL